MFALCFRFQVIREAQAVIICSLSAESEYSKISRHQKDFGENYRCGFNERESRFSVSLPFSAAGFAGTPGYLSPEVLRKDPYGKPVDIWACGKPIPRTQLVGVTGPWLPVMT